jgi:hypothetical protein
LCRLSREIGLNVGLAQEGEHLAPGQLLDHLAGPCSAPPALMSCLPMRRPVVLTRAVDAEPRPTPDGSQAAPLQLGVDGTDEKSRLPLARKGVDSRDWMLAGGERRAATPAGVQGHVGAVARPRRPRGG